MAVAGFDVGSQTSLFAVPKGGGIEVLLNDYSQRTTPCVPVATPEGRKRHPVTHTLSFCSFFLFFVCLSSVSLILLHKKEWMSEKLCRYREKRQGEQEERESIKQDPYSF